jgi:hypothetical protein
MPPNNNNNDMPSEVAEAVTNKQQQQNLLPLPLQPHHQNIVITANGLTNYTTTNGGANFSDLKASFYYFYKFNLQLRCKVEIGLLGG